MASEETPLAGVPDPASPATLITRWEDDGRILVVTLNRPDRLNAFDARMMRELSALWDTVAGTPGVRCVVVTGAGKGFCAGADASMLESTRTRYGATSKEELAFLPRHRVEVPVVVAVNGVCAGGGLHFVAEGDIVIAGESASFLDPHVTMGQVTALEPVMLALRARFDVITRMALLGRSERLDAAAAQEAGLVSEVVPDGTLLDRALELARAIAANSPAAVRRSRKALVDLEETLLRAVMDRGWDSIRAHWAHPDATEGPAAFLEGRSPVWSSAS
ncbi:crotonase [Actinomadura sp. NBRC 104412]|uniref:enoyl-CoA hydratase/isomerase family protein n=1 Tax=Actinomadura sp. NBRC 104412 TaxID=3032203 RepID=UPI00249FE24B|nr:enoyl-CoA hydratase/isomerase family protein [Actinomadura sp. NBRC 104412]GLZ06182.1 crotonase [Actinomadura sp. NBRC 104412]